ncbi:unnamed protein product [Durusdinium trenchii]|uniref:Calponin-homology (CH) domain-containing protein n=1 Tax=Durusdinium trenchii TaxID=1381693 RepID=A0ABP0SP26_9DINO
MPSKRQCFVLEECDVNFKQQLSRNTFDEGAKDDIVKASPVRGTAEGMPDCSSQEYNFALGMGQCRCATCQGIPGAAIDAFFQRIATRVVQDLEDAPVVAPPSEEEVALAWWKRGTFAVTSSVQSCEAQDLPCYGLDAELKAKAAAKYSRTAEEAAAHWVEAVTGHHVQGNFGTILRSGAILCDLINCIQPGTIAKVNTPGMPFKERENICNFLRACRTFGVQEYALFSTDDLYDEKNLMSVVNCLHALGGAVQRSVPGFVGPHLGVPDTSNTKRDFKRDLGPVSQTGGLRGPLERSHLDMVSNSNVRVGGC